MPFLKKTYTFAKKSLLNLYLNFSLQPFPNIVTINKHDCKKVILKENPFTYKKGIFSDLQTLGRYDDRGGFVSDNLYVGSIVSHVTVSDDTDI